LRLQDRARLAERDFVTRPRGLMPPELMVGLETSDDAAVYRLEHQALVATDFFTPSSTTRDFGRIAATNALSDIYAMGGTPILALALVGMPIAKLSPETIGECWPAAPRSAARPASRWPAAIRSTCSSPSTAWWPWAWCTLIACGAMPTRRPATCWCWASRWAWAFCRPRSRRAARRGRLRRDAGPHHALNRVGRRWRLAGVHAMTDVTGFGLAGHLLDVPRFGPAGRGAAGRAAPDRVAQRFAREGWSPALRRATGPLWGRHRLAGQRQRPGSRPWCPIRRPAAACW
jgi:selenide,water dikinase